MFTVKQWGDNAEDRFTWGDTSKTPAEQQLALTADIEEPTRATTTSRFKAKDLGQLISMEPRSTITSSAGIQSYYAGAQGKDMENLVTGGQRMKDRIDLEHIREGLRQAKKHGLRVEGSCLDFAAGFGARVKSVMDAGFN